MELSTRNTLGALAEAHGDASLVPDGKPRLHQNAPICTTFAGESAKGAVPVELSAQKLKAIGLLIAGRTFSQAAAEMGVDRSTVFRWRREADFSAELRRRLGETLDVVAMRTRAAMLKSTDLIAAAMLSKDEKHRANIAFKVINSKRIWDIGNTLPTLPEE